MAPEKTDPSPPSSSDSLQSAQFLERLLGAIAKALDGLVEGDQELKRSFELLRRRVDLSIQQGDLNAKLFEKRNAELIKALTKFMEHVELIVAQHKTVAGATDDARRAIDDSRRSFDTAIGAFREASGKHPTLKAEEEIEEISLQWIKIRPMTLVKYGPPAIKILGILATAAGSIYAMIKGLAPLIRGWH